MKVAIIGGGAAGVYLAMLLRNVHEAEPHPLTPSQREGGNTLRGLGELHSPKTSQTKVEVCLFEKRERLGEKLRLTGGGRMNLMNKGFGVEKFVSSEPNILKKIFKTPEAAEVLRGFEEIGAEWVWEGERAIIKSNSAEKEVTRMTEELQQSKNVRLRLGGEVKEIQADSGQAGMTYKINGEEFDVVVLATGGMLRLGETPTCEEAYKLATELGHTLTETRPALSPLIIGNEFFAGLEGLSAEVKLKDKETSESVIGEIMFTQNGISGPAVLDFSLVYGGEKIKLNFLPTLAEGELRRMIGEKRKGRNGLRRLLHNFLPQRLADWQLTHAGIERERVIADLRKDELDKLIQGLYFLTVKNVRLAPYKASWTTKGGVSLREVNTNTLESKLHPNLFLAGEMLDVTGVCGGFNLGFCMLSAMLIKKELEKRIEKL